MFIDRMNSTAQFQQAIERLEALTQGLLTAESEQTFQEKKQEFEAQLAASQYLKVPCVGVFSAGKSSLLNVFTQKSNMLPVDTLPETAVSYELYYDTNERVELFREGQLREKQPLVNIKQLDAQPGDVAKVYCDSTVVRELQERGIILVDMPGIGSGIERHDRAIYHYIQDGTAFVLMVDADQGSLRAQTLSFLSELKVFSHYPAVFITKADKKPEAELAKVKDYIAYQVKNISEQTPTVGVLSAVNQQLEDFRSYIYSLDADAMIRRKMSAHFGALADHLKASLAVRIEIRQQDVANVEEQISSMEAEIAKAQTEMPHSDQADTPEQSTRDILDEVRQALEGQASNVARMIAASESEDAIKSVILSTVRTTLVRSLQSESEQYAEALGAAIQASTQELAGLDLNVDVMGEFDNIMTFVNAVLMFIPVGGWVGRVVTLVMANLPIVRELVGWLFGKSQEDVMDEARQAFLNKVPEMVDNLRSPVLNIVTENQRRIAAGMQNELVAQMNRVRDGLREKQTDAQKTKERVNEELAMLRKTIGEIEALTQSI